MAHKSGDSDGKSTALNIISPGTSVDGDIVTNSSIRVGGKIKGTLKCGQTLTISESGEIEGVIQAKNAVVSGKIQGKVNVQEKLVLRENSRLVGELKSKKLIIEEGAIFDGASDMGVTQTAANIPSRKPEVPEAS